MHYLSYRISELSIERIVKKTCSAIWDQLLQAGHLNCPKSKDKWKRVAIDFDYCWNLPNSVGAIDGKHVTIQCPPLRGSMFYNYKKYHSIVMSSMSSGKCIWDSHFQISSI